jgi:hypothetical protein
MIFLVFICARLVEDDASSQEIMTLHNNFSNFQCNFKHHSWKYWVTSLETTPNGTITILIIENEQDVITKKLTIIGHRGDLRSDALKD